MVRATTRIAILCGILSSVGMTGTAIAGPNSGAAIALHLVEALSSDACLSSTPIPGCPELVSQVPVAFTPVYAYLLIEQGDPAAGIGGSSFGIYYDAAPGAGVDVFSWTACADMQVGPGWPAAGSGLTVTWNPGNCQRRVTGDGHPFLDGAAAVAGYFYLSSYGPGQIGVTPHPATGQATVRDCSGVVDLLGGVPSPLGGAGLGGPPGYNPCLGLHLGRCGIEGPTSCTAGQSNLVFADNGFHDRYSWTIEGNGTIVGPTDQSSVIVQAGGPGTFTLRLAAAYDVEAHFCQRVVDVQGAVAIDPTTWTRVKTLIRGE